MIMTTTAAVDHEETFPTWESVSSASMETWNTNPSTLDATVGESIVSTLTSLSEVSSTVSSTTESAPPRKEVLSMRAGYERQDSSGVWSSATQIMSNSTISTKQRLPSMGQHGMINCSAPPVIPRRRSTLKTNQQLFLMMEMFNKFQSDQSLQSLIEDDKVLPQEDEETTSWEELDAPAEKQLAGNRGLLREPNDPFPPMMPNRLESDQGIHSRSINLVGDLHLHDQANLPPCKPLRQDSADVSLLGFDDDHSRRRSPKAHCGVHPRLPPHVVNPHAFRNAMSTGGVSSMPAMPYRQDSIQSSAGDLSPLTAPPSSATGVSSLIDTSSSQPLCHHDATSQVSSKISATTAGSDSSDGSTTSVKLGKTTPTSGTILRGRHFALKGTRSCAPRKPRRRESLNGIREEDLALLLDEDDEEDNGDVTPLSSSSGTIRCSLQQSRLSSKKGGKGDSDDDDDGHPEEPSIYVSVPAKTTRLLDVQWRRRSFSPETA